MSEANRSRPLRPIASRQNYLQWFTEVVDALGVSRMTLMGNSMGGWGAAHIAMHLRNRVTGLVLISPAATFHSIAPFYLHLFLPKAAYLLLPFLPGVEPSMRRCVDWAWAGLPSAGPRPDLFYLALVHGSTQSRVFPRVFNAAELAAIEGPSLPLVGDHERIYPPGEVDQAAHRLMPTVEVGVVPSAHHIAAVAEPAAVAERVLSFLAHRA